MLYLWISLEWVSSSPLGLSTQVKDILTDPSKHLFSFLFIILWFQAHLCHDFLKKIDCIKENSANFNPISFVLKHNYVLKQMIERSVFEWMTILASIQSPFFIKKIPRPSEFEIVFFWEVGQCAYCVSDISPLLYKIIWLIKKIPWFPGQHELLKLMWL